MLYGNRTLLGSRESGDAAKCKLVGHSFVDQPIR